MIRAAEANAFLEDLLEKHTLMADSSGELSADQAAREFLAQTQPAQTESTPSKKAAAAARRARP